MSDESQFTEYLNQLNTPETSGYEFFTKCKGEGFFVEFYRRFDKDSGLYHYQGYGELESVDTETVYKVYTDLEYRLKWDSYCNDLRVLSEDDSQQHIYWRVAYPWPMSHRDYVFIRKSKVFEEDDNIPKRWCIIGRAAISSTYDEVKGVVRVKEYEQTLAFQKNETGEGTKIFLYYFDNPGGSLPTWLINYGAKTGVPQFMTSLRQACQKYDK